MQFTGTCSLKNNTRQTCGTGRLVQGLLKIESYPTFINGSEVKLYAITTLIMQTALKCLLLPPHPFSQFSKFWLVLQYVCFVVIVLVALALCNTTLTRLIVLDTAILFLYTEAWMMHIRTGQVYIIIAALFGVIAHLLIKPKSTWAAIFAAACITLLIFTRPIAIVLLTPFLIYYRQYKKLIIYTLACSSLYIVFYLVNPFEMALWKDYAAGLAEQVKIHQQTGAALQHNDTLKITMLEGYDLGKGLKLSAATPNKSENGNIFHIYYIYLHRHIPLYVLNGLWVIVMLLCCIFYYRKVKPASINTEAAIIFGLTLYMLTEIFSPVHRHQYNTVQWLPIILIAFACMRNYRNLATLFIAIGIILNISNTHLLPMRHTIGEFLLLAGLLVAVYRQKDLLRTGV